MRLMITQDNKLVALVEDYEGPVPGVGQYIIRPDLDEPRPGLVDHFMQVKVVNWGIIARPPRKGPGYFVGAAEPFVEVVV